MMYGAYCKDYANNKTQRAMRIEIHFSNLRFDAISIRDVTNEAFYADCKIIITSQSQLDPIVQ